jgi:hypothetical protein
MAAFAILRTPAPRSDDLRVEPAFDERDVTSILNGVFYLNVHLAKIADDIRAIRLLLEDGDEEEEEEDSGEGPPA